MMQLFLNLPLAHTGTHGPQNMQELIRAWEFEPFAVLALAASAWLYARGIRRLRRNAGANHGIHTWEIAAYWAGWLSLVIALLSPLHPWGRALFSVHMTQHEILMLISAPLLVLGRPGLVYLLALPRGLASDIGRGVGTSAWRRTWRVISHPIAAWIIHTAALWVWHIPSLFQATLESDLIHTAQHASFFGSALLFWWALIHGRNRALGYGVAAIYMFTTAMQSGGLGVLLTYAATVWYPAYESSARAWGLSPLEDQQLGGLIMWIPAGLVYVIAGLALIAGSLREAERRAARWQSRVTLNSETQGGVV